MSTRDSKAIRQPLTSARNRLVYKSQHRKMDGTTHLLREPMYGVLPLILQDIWHIPAAQEDCRMKSGTNSPNNYTVLYVLHSCKCHSLQRAARRSKLFHTQHSTQLLKHINHLTSIILLSVIIGVASYQRSLLRYY